MHGPIHKPVMSGLDFLAQLFTDPVLSSIIAKASSRPGGASDCKQPK